MPFDIASRNAALKYPGAGPRLIWILLDLGRQYDQRVDGGSRLPSAITQTVIAELACLNRSTAGKVINDYRRLGVLGGEHRTLVIYPEPAQKVLADSTLGPIA